MEDVMESTKHRYIYPYELKTRKKVRKVIDKKEKRMTKVERELIRDIEQAYKEMITMFHHFDYAVEPDLIEYYTYQYKAAQIKYDYLLRCMKEIYYSNMR